MSVAIISRERARQIGMRWYYTGQPCKHGHIAERNVSEGKCRACLNERDRARLNEERKAQNRRSYAKHVDRRREYDKQRYYGNPSRNAWQNKQANEWWKSNRGKKNAMTAARRAQLKRATPPWLSAAHKRQIQQIYIDAQKSGLHVDHEVPLRGENVCGLHVPWNLQQLTAVANRRKRNVFAS